MKTKKWFKVLVLASLLTGVASSTFGSGPEDTGGRPPIVMQSV